MQILQINSSARSAGANSTRLADAITARLKAANPAAVVELRDLAANPHPVLDEAVFPVVLGRVGDAARFDRLGDVGIAAEIPRLVDIDLAILGVSPARFAEYDAQVAAEYAWVPRLVYRFKRKQVLQSFLQRDAIYATPHFHQLLEAQARRNLSQT